MGAVWGAGVPADVITWQLVEQTGWTLEYIDSLPLARVHQWLSIQDGLSKARASQRKSK
jgi:hypothetical protein